VTSPAVLVTSDLPDVGKMFQKHSIMSMKKKSKSLGHLTALNSHPGSPQIETKVSIRIGLGEVGRAKVIMQGKLIAVAYALCTYCNQFSLGGIVNKNRCISVRLVSEEDKSI